MFLSFLYYFFRTPLLFIPSTLSHFFSLAFYLKFFRCYSPYACFFTIRPFLPSIYYSLSPPFSTIRTLLLFYYSLSIFSLLFFLYCSFIPSLFFLLLLFTLFFFLYYSLSYFFFSTIRSLLIIKWYKVHKFYLNSISKIQQFHLSVNFYKNITTKISQRFKIPQRFKFP